MATFEVYLKNDDGTEQVHKRYSSIAWAQKISKSLRDDGKPWKFRRVVLDDSWKQRERDRFNNGTYAKVPWHDESWFTVEHFCTYYTHMSRDGDGAIAYTKSPEHGEDDRQTKIKPGKYLTEFFSDVLTPEEINRWVAKCQEDMYELEFIEKPEDIVKAYQGDASHSCMSYGVGSYDTHGIHPVLVYGKPGDIILAVLKNKLSGRHIARALVWPEKKVHTRVYGHIAAMEEMLELNGYEYGSFDGAKLNFIKTRKGFVCPYIDSFSFKSEGTRSAYVKTDGVDLYLSDNGGLDACTTSGYISLSSYKQCEVTDYYYYEGDMFQTKTGYVCHDIGRDYVRCHDGYYYPLDQVEAVVFNKRGRTMYYPIDELSTIATKCCKCNKYVLNTIVNEGGCTLCNIDHDAPNPYGIPDDLLSYPHREGTVLVPISHARQDYSLVKGRRYRVVRDIVEIFEY